MAASSRCGVGASSNGGFYKCEECSKWFNRMASYEAHIRMHAQEEQLDVLDVVFNYTGPGSGYDSEDRAEGRDAGKKRRTKSQSPPDPKPVKSLRPISPPSAAAVPPSRRVSGNHTLKIVELLLSDAKRDIRKRSRGTDRSCVSSTSKTVSVDLVGTPASSSGANKEGEVLPTLLQGRWTLYLTIIIPHLYTWCAGGSGSVVGPLIVRLPRKLCSVGDSSEASSLSSPQQEPSPSSPKKFARVVRLDSLCLPETSDTESKSCDESPPDKIYHVRKRRVTTSPRFKCHLCHRLLSTSSALKRHNLLHTGERPFKCSFCFKSFTQPHHKANHELTHYVVPHKTNKGNVDSDSLSSSYSLENNQHLYRCDICGLIVVGLPSFKAHVTSHDMKRRFQCSVCGMRFFRKLHLECHVQAHKERRFQCNYCNRVFLHSKSLDRHLLLHVRSGTYTSPPPGQKYKCKYCTKLCRSLSGLARHHEWHLSPKGRRKASSVCQRENGRNGASRIEDGEIIPKSAHIMERKMLPKLPEDDVFTSDLEEEGSEPPSVRVGGETKPNDLELELDSFSDDEEEGETLNVSDTETEGELADVSNNDGTATAEESTDDGLESEQSNLYDVRTEGDMSDDESESEMSPLRLETDEESSEDFEEEEEEEGAEEKKEKDLSSKDFRHFVQCSGKVQESGAAYPNPHNHKKGRGGVPQYKCEWCGRLFLRRDYLRQHYYLHQQVPHQCQLCGKVFMSRRYLMRHLNTAHDN